MADNFTERENYILSNSVNVGWFLKAIDKNNPTHPQEGAAHTESYELDGQNILVPRVRIKDGKAVLNKENALEEALEKGDYIVVPEGEDPDQYSKDLSKLIGKFRGYAGGVGAGLATQKSGYADGGMTESPRPKMRPELNLSYDDLKKIERVVWGEARDQGVEGRNAIRGVILNRLMSKRFPNTVDEVLSAKEFEPIRKYKGINNIPVDAETLDIQMQEMADYIQMGEDASKGSTFFLNKPVAKKRGTDFEGPNGFTINDHTFYSGYEGQEPVTDVNFSHDVRVGMAEGGLMEDQMEMMFKSSRTDPVSGNEVPIGSNPEEVRDDIPAMLSEGEYVVPSDVVRYYGVKFFEDLRTNAKMGLQDMAENGRIGGEPMDAPQEQEMSDDEFLMIVGSMMNGPQEMNEGGVVRGYNQAGLATQPITPDFSKVPGFSTFSQQPLAQQYLVPGAMTMGVQPEITPESQGPSPEYCANLGMSYDAETKTCVPKTPAPAFEAPRVASDDDDGPKPPAVEPKDWYDDIDWNDPTDKIDSLTGAPGLMLEGASAIGSAAFGPLGAVAGPIMEVSNLANAHAMANIYQAMGNTKLADQIRGKISTRLESSSITKGAYNAIDSVFGADGDRKTMQFLEAAGVDLSSLDGKRGKDLTAAMDNLLANMGTEDKRKVQIYAKYQTPEPILKAETKKQAAAAVDDYAALVNQPVATSSDSGSNEYNKPIVTQKSIQETKDILAKSEDKEDTTENLQRTTSKIEDLTSGRNTSGQVGFNKGGLMLKKKK